MRIAEHNNLIKVVFDGSKHLKHIMSAEQAAKVSAIEGRYPLSRMPVCGHCEKIGLWHRGGTAYCPVCGTYTKHPITYSTYLASGYDIDKTTARWMLEKEQNKRKKVLPNFGE